MSPPHTHTMVCPPPHINDDPGAPPQTHVHDNPLHTPSYTHLNTHRGPFPLLHTHTHIYILAPPTYTPRPHTLTSHLDTHMDKCPPPHTHLDLTPYSHGSMPPTHTHGSMLPTHTHGPMPPPTHTLTSHLVYPPTTRTHLHLPPFVPPLLRPPTPHPTHIPRGRKWR